MTTMTTLPHTPPALPPMPPPVRPGSDLEWHTARQIARGVRSLRATEQVPLAAAHGRILAQPVRALTAAPAFDTAAMDGYAVRGEGPWRIVGRVLAGGECWTQALSPGSAVEIATGATVPPRACAVIPYECCHVDGALVFGALGHRDHIRRTGEDALVGEELVSAGRRVNAAVLGVAAQSGADTVHAYRRLRVSILVTGDEIVTHGIPGPGQVRDALGPVVQALMRRVGAVIVDQHMLADDGDVLRAAVEDATAADVVIVTGSSSAGAADHLRSALDRLGAHWHVDGVLCRPGHPQALAELDDGRWVVGLPGNPFAGLAAALTLLEPLLGALSGLIPAASLLLPVFGPAAVHPSGVRLVPVRVDGAHARVVPGAKPGSLRAAALADAVAVIDPYWTEGGLAELLPLHCAGS